MRHKIIVTQAMAFRAAATIAAGLVQRPGRYSTEEIADQSLALAYAIGSMVEHDAKRLENPQGMVDHVIRYLDKPDESNPRS